MNMKDIYAFIDKARESGFDEIGLEVDGVKISLKKNEVHQVIAPSKPSVIAVPVSEVKAVETEPAVDDSVAVIKAPFVGTFYRAASPEDKPFVMVGQEVKKGDVVGIIEAMKLMNEITATEDGIVEAILVEDAVMVEYNQSLIQIKKK